VLANSASSKIISHQACDAHRNCNTWKQVSSDEVTVEVINPLEKRNFYFYTLHVAPKIYIYIYRGEANPVTGLGGLQGREMLRIL
jgi:hypothetical protein